MRLCSRLFCQHNHHNSEHPPSTSVCYACWQGIACLHTLVDAFWRHAAKQAAARPAGLPHTDQGYMQKTFCTDSAAIAGPA